MLQCPFLPGDPLDRLHRAVGFRKPWEDAGCSLEEQGGPWVLNLGLAYESNIIAKGVGDPGSQELRKDGAWGRVKVGTQ